MFNKRLRAGCMLLKGAKIIDTNYQLIVPFISMRSYAYVCERVFTQFIEYSTSL